MIWQALWGLLPPPVRMVVWVLAAVVIVGSLALALLPSAEERGHDR